MKKLFNKDQKGFTIIEVMIVLAIAGLIIGVVLVAIPQLQRNQRNSSRKSIVSRIKTEIDNYQGNNNGKIPTAAADITSFTTRYLTGVNRDDPKLATPMPVSYVTTATDYTAGSVFVGTVGTISYKDAVTCDGELAATGSARQYAMWTRLEGDAIYCVDNK